MSDENRKIFDSRVIHKNMQKGTVKEAEFKNYLKSLPDETNNAQWIEMDIHETDSNSHSED